MTGERERRERERRREKIMPSLMATLLRWRTHSARTKSLYFCSRFWQGRYPCPNKVKVVTKVTVWAKISEEGGLTWVLWGYYGGIRTSSFQYR
jgi:hypothetical protein